MARLLDLVPGAVAAYSTRKIRSAYAGHCVRVRNAETADETNIGFTEDGVLDEAAALAAAAPLIGEGKVDLTAVTWYDQSEEGIDSVQTSASAQPLVFTGVGETFPRIGAHVAFSHNGSSQAMTRNAVAAFFADTQQPMMFAAVVHLASTAGSQGVIDVALGSAAANRSRYALFMSGGGSPAWVWRNASGAGNTVVTGGTPGTGAAVVLVGVASGTTIELWINGTSIGTADRGSFAITPDTAAGGAMSISSALANVFNGRKSEEVMWPIDPTTEQRQTVEGSMAWAAEIEDDLSAGHPYETFPPESPPGSSPAPGSWRRRNRNKRGARL